MVFKSSARSYVECITLCTTYTHVYSKVDTKRQRTARFIYRIQPPSNNHSNMVFVFTLSMSFRGQWTCPSLMSGIPPYSQDKNDTCTLYSIKQIFFDALTLEIAVQLRTAWTRHQQDATTSRTEIREELRNATCYSAAFTSGHCRRRELRRENRCVYL